MSFWAGVVQGVKDIDVLKEKEALAAERERIQKYNEARDRKADERWERQWASQQEQYLTAQERLDRGEQLVADALLFERDSEMAVYTGDTTFTGVGEVPKTTVSQAMADAQITLNADIKATQEREGVTPEESAAAGRYANISPGSALEVQSFLELHNEATGSRPSFQELSTMIDIITNPNLEQSLQQKSNLLIQLNGLDPQSGKDQATAKALVKQLEKLDQVIGNPDAVRVNETPISRTERATIYALQDSQFTTGFSNWLVNKYPDTFTEYATAPANSPTRLKIENEHGQEAFSKLYIANPAVFNVAGNARFANFNIPAEGTEASGGNLPREAAAAAGATLPTIPKAKEAFIADPLNQVARGDLLALVGKEEVARIEESMKYPAGFTAGAVGPDGKLGGGSYSIEASGAVPVDDFGVFPEASAIAIREKYGEEFGQEGTQKVVDTVKHVWNNTGEYMLKGADRGAGMVLGSANEVLSWLAVGVGGLNEVLGLDGTDAFAAAGEFDEVAGKLWNGGISAADASQEITDIFYESLTRDLGDEERMAAAYGPERKVPPTREEIDTGSTPEGAAIKEAINSLVSGVQQIIPATDSKSMPDGYTPTQMGATELNLPKILEALSPETRKIVEAELQVTAGDTNLGRMEQSRLGRVGAESDRLSTESKSMPDGYRPTQMGATELNSPKVRSALDAVVAPYVEAKGSPLTEEEELAIGIEALIKGLTSNVMPQDELDALVMDLQAKFTAERVREALSLAMNK